MVFFRLGFSLFFPVFLSVIFTVFFFYSDQALSSAEDGLEPKNTSQPSSTVEILDAKKIDISFALYRDSQGEFFLYAVTLGAPKIELARGVFELFDRAPIYLDFHNNKYHGITLMLNLSEQAPLARRFPGTEKYYYQKINLSDFLRDVPEPKRAFKIPNNRAQHSERFLTLDLEAHGITSKLPANESLDGFTLHFLNSALSKEQVQRSIFYIPPILEVEGQPVPDNLAVDFMFNYRAVELGSFQKLYGALPHFMEGLQRIADPFSDPQKSIADWRLGVQSTASGDIGDWRKAIDSLTSQLFSERIIVHVDDFRQKHFANPVEEQLQKDRVLSLLLNVREFEGIPMDLLVNELFSFSNRSMTTMEVIIQVKERVFTLENNPDMDLCLHFLLSGKLNPPTKK